MRFRLVPTLVVAAIVAAAVFAGMTANPANSYPSKAQACTSCHPAAPASATVSATPSTATPAAGANYVVTVNLAGLTSSGDTGYWISNAAGTPTVSVFGGDTGTNQSSYTRTMTAPATPGTYSYTVWCDRGTKSSGQAKSTTYRITVPAATAAISSLTPSHGQTGATVVIAGTNLGSPGAVRFGTATATTSAWSATSVTCTVPASLANGAVNVTVTPSGRAASNARSFTVNAPSGIDTTAPTTTASGAGANGWYNHTVTVGLTATDDVGGSGVASIAYSIDGGAPITVIGSSATVIISAAAGHENDGPHTVTFQATDAAGNAEAAQTRKVNIDTRRPWTKAPRSAKVRRYNTAILAYVVRDAAPNGGTAKAVIVIKNSRGVVVKVLNLGNKPVNTSLTARFGCSLRPGTYKFRVYGTDRAGSTQADTATNTLTVYPRS